MAKKIKTFDCVEMKRQAQARLMGEFEAQKGKFSSFAEFIRSTAGKSPWGRSLRARIRRAKARVVS